MKVFRDLFIRSNSDTMQRVVELIEQKLTDGWQRDRAAEKRSGQMGETQFFYFTCNEKPGRSSALVALVKKADWSLYVSNVVPRLAGQLTHNEYNSILEEFANRFAVPAAQHLEIGVELTPAQESIEDWISADSVQKLKQFSAIANKSTGSSHPCDQQRWFAFLVSVHAEHRKLHSDYLVRWLVECDGWPEDIARELASEYDFAMELLDYHAGIRR